MISKLKKNVAQLSSSDLVELFDSKPNGYMVCLKDGELERCDQKNGSYKVIEYPSQKTLAWITFFPSAK